jgi:hypothetical protein
LFFCFSGLVISPCPISFSSFLQLYQCGCLGKVMHSIFEIHINLIFLIRCSVLHDKDEEMRSLQIISERMVPNRWDHARPPNKSEVCKILLFLPSWTNKIWKAESNISNRIRHRNCIGQKTNRSSR